MVWGLCRTASLFEGCVCRSIYESESATYFQMIHQENYQPTNRYIVYIDKRVSINVAKY